MDSFAEFRKLLQGIDMYYEGFEHGVISYIKMPGNEYKQKMIEDYIIGHPDADVNDVTSYMMEETGFWEIYANYLPSGRPDILAAK